MIADNQRHGFLRSSAADFTTVSVPDAARRPARARSRTLLTIAGRCRTFIEANFQSHGFLRGADGTLTAFDPPGSASTGVSGINLSGEIVGDYDDSSFKTLGFLRSAIGALKD